MEMPVFFLRRHIIVVLQTGAAQQSTGRVEKAFLCETAQRLGHVQVAAVEQHHIVDGRHAEAAELHVIAAVGTEFVEIERDMRLETGEGELELRTFNGHELRLVAVQVQPLGVVALLFQVTVDIGHRNHCELNLIKQGGVFLLVQQHVQEVEHRFSAGRFVAVQAALHPDADFACA